MAKQSTTGLELINRDTLVEVMTVALKADRPLLIYGTPGIAKSETVREVLNDQGYVMADFRFGNIPPEDLAGIAWPNQETKRVERYMPDVIAKCWELHEATGKPVGVFMDEVNHTPHSAQGPLYSFVNDRQCAGFPLPPGTRIIAAGNPDGSGSISEDMSRALLDRFMLVEYAGPTPEEYERYAIEAGLHAVVRAYLKDNPNKLDDFDAEAMVSPTPRSWTNLSKMLEHATTLEQMIQAAVGHVGMETGQHFTAYLEQFGKLPSFEEVLNDPEGAKLPKQFSGQYMMGLTVAAKLAEFWDLDGSVYLTSADENFIAARERVHVAAMAYTMRLPAEIQVASIVQMLGCTFGPNGTGKGSSAFLKMMSDYRKSDPKNAEKAMNLTKGLQKMEKAISEMGLAA